MTCSFFLSGYAVLATKAVRSDDRRPHVGLSIVSVSSEQWRRTVASKTSRFGKTQRRTRSQTGLDRRESKYGKVNRQRDEDTKGKIEDFKRENRDER